MEVVDESTIKAAIDPICHALGEYQSISEGKVRFDISAAAHLKWTPDKPYTARSASQVKHCEEVIGKLYVILFDAYDGTGDESSFELTNAMAGGSYPLMPKVVPRKKDGIRSEAHLAIATLIPNQAPTMFGNSLDLIGLQDGHFTQLAQLGHDGGKLWRTLEGRDTVGPSVTLTTGYSPYSGERFGDPHSVYNKQPFVQVAGFLAITDEISTNHSAVLGRLGAQVPASCY